MAGDRSSIGSRRIEQVGAPGDIYYAPKTPFVARFFGDNNLIEANVRDGRVETAIASFALPAGARTEPRPILVAVRPEKISIGGGDGGRTAIVCKVDETTFTGALTQVKARPLASAQTTLLVKMTSDPGRPLPERGAETTLSFAPDAIALVEVAS